MSRNKTRSDIIEAAVELFNTKGYAGTSVRDISKKANVNVANISYYFKGKQGLLEECLTSFFEMYLTNLEKEVFLLETTSPHECLKRAIRNILTFQRENHLLTRFVWREVTIDSQIVREIISSYLVKERYFFKSIIEKGVQEGAFVNLPISLVIIQLKSMLSMPFLNSQYLREVWQVFPHEKYFIDKYMVLIERWIDETLSTPTTAINMDKKGVI
ncbi:AcrR family transcriptional regulator [Oikeobacillus pervagus]|uniref:AcrR family transcriptional regulator n=1 Tax=Oikeobacillus pervagus TaxID=1325931 RepID=A0AAJ1SY98_9BACI|nr:forespore capture DNA-binding protein RefZ [Oikeobacillus pervagus]MDQ0215020.1 AcrR family transcriptional regulator [Oikeobacillus pervagus]